MPDAKIINYGQQINAGTTVIPDDAEVALKIETTTAGEDYILIDSENNAENLTLAGGGYPVLIGTDQRGPRMRQGHGSSAVTDFPVYTFRGDTNTGMTHLGTSNDDTVVLVAGGVEGFRVLESGDTARPQTIGSVATALTGTFTATNGSAEITSGSSTAFTTQLHVGSAIELFEGSTSRGVFTVSAIGSDTALTLDSTVSGLSSSPKAGMTGKTDGGELFAVKTGDSQTRFAVNASGAMTFGTNPGTEGSSIAIGDGDALDTLTTGKSNIIIGHASDNYKLTTGKRHIFIGYRAGEDMTTTDNNVVIGFEGAQAATGADNVFIGAEVAKNATGNDSVAVGFKSMMNATGSDCVAIGSSALLECTGSNNVAIGSGALDKVGNAHTNVAIGKNALTNQIAGKYNVAVGESSMFSGTDGEGNTVIGYSSGSVITTGDNNTILGREAQPSAYSGINQVVIGNSATGQGDNTVTLGGSTITGLHCATQTIDTLSDSRIKDNVRDSGLGLDFINALRPVKYEKKHPSEYPEEIREGRWSHQEYPSVDSDGNPVMVTRPADTKPDDWQPRTEYGLIAQEVKATMEAHGGADWQGHTVLPSGAESLGYGNLITVLVKAVQELTARLEQLEGGG